MMVLSISAYADDYDTFVNEDISVYYLVTKSATSTLSISGTTATCVSKVNGFTSTTTIGITQTLEKYVILGISSTVNDAEWTKTFNSASATYSNSKSALTSGTYRVKSVFTVTTSNGQSETITVYSSKKTIN